MDNDGANLKQLTVAREPIESFVWSPDGERIVFVARGERDDEALLWVIDSDGENLRQLARKDVFDVIRAPSWSPDGKRIVFEVDDAVLHSNIWVVNSDGTNLRQLTAPKSPSSAPKWNPVDNKRIAAFILDDIWLLILEK